MTKGAFRFNRRRRKGLVWNLIFLLIGCVWFVPVYYLLVTTFKTAAEATESPLGLPGHFTLGNYAKAFESMHFFQAFRNNLVITGFSVILLILFASMTAYAIARSRSKFASASYLVFTMGIIVPFQTSIIPLYKIIKALHLMDSFGGIILINTFCINLPLSIFLLKGFIGTIPVELEEASYMDGAGTLGTFWRIVFPLLRPVIATVAILNSLSIWNDFMTPLLFLQDPNKAVLMQEVYKNVGPFSTDWTSFFPMLVLSVLPLVVFYLVAQRHIIEGVVAGAVKG